MSWLRRALLCIVLIGPSSSQFTGLNGRTYDAADPACDPGALEDRSGSVVGGASDCARQGEFGRYKTCVEVFLSDAEVGWRCICNPLMIPRGPECDDAPTSQLVLLILMFGALVLLNFFTAIYAARLVHAMLRVSKFRPNAAIVATSLMTVCCACEAIRYSLYVLRNLPTSSGVTLADTNFNYSLQVVLGISILTVVQGLLSLGLAWIRVAEKSKRLKTA